MQHIDPQPRPSVPVHVAVIMDGNGRWARSRGLPRTMGHRKGVETVRRVVEAAGDLGVAYLTLFGFSTENWARPDEEVGELMRLLRMFLRSEVADLHDNGVRLRVIGDRTRLAGDIVGMIAHAEDLTAGNSALHLTVALSYGSRQEIVMAARQLARAAKAGEIDPDAIDETMLEQRLFTRDLPNPDLIIRTSGEQRISNFLLWQAAYAELVFVDTLWPDFTTADFEQAIGEYQRRERRYGATVNLP
ncbi:MAG: isoprenyl transferase [Inquilinaceae bacterium]